MTTIASQRAPLTSKQAVCLGPERIILWEKVSGPWITTKTVGQLPFDTTSLQTESSPSGIGYPTTFRPSSSGRLACRSNHYSFYYKKRFWSISVLTFRGKNMVTIRKFFKTHDLSLLKTKTNYYFKPIHVVYESAKLN